MSSSKIQCSDCSSYLSKDEVGLNKKIFPGYIDKGVILCFSCMSDFLDCSISDLKEKIKQFKEQGCKLFQ